VEALRRARVAELIGQAVTLALNGSSLRHVSAIRYASSKRGASSEVGNSGHGFRAVRAEAKACGSEVGFLDPPLAQRVRRTISVHGGCSCGGRFGAANCEETSPMRQA